MEQKYDHSCSYQFRLHELSKNKGSGFEIKKTHFAPAKKKIWYSLESNVLNTHWQ